MSSWIDRDRLPKADLSMQTANAVECHMTGEEQDDESESPIRYPFL